jgi:hypothetical protein
MARLRVVLGLNGCFGRRSRDAPLDLSNARAVLDATAASAAGGGRRSCMIALQPGACSAAKTKTDDEMTHTAETAAAAAAGCSCMNASLCRPLGTPHPLHETFVAMIHERTVPYLNYSVRARPYVFSRSQQHC